MMNRAFPDTIGRSAAVVAPGLMVMAIILFMGRVSGAHLNPVVSIAFALRRDFPWTCVPGYIVVQVVGATLAALVLREVITVSATYGSNYPVHGHSDMAAFWMELLLTMGLVSVILGTASGAQNVGLLGALGVGGYIALSWALGESHLWCFDEPCADIRSRPHRQRFHRVLGLRCRTARRRWIGSNHRLRSPRRRGREGWVRVGPRWTLHGDPRGRKVLAGSNLRRSLSPSRSSGFHRTCGSTPTAVGQMPG